MNLSGKWIYSEDFGFGKDNGFAVIEHKEDQITGFIEYIEEIEDETPFKIRQHIEGEIDGNNITFQGVSHEILESEQAIEYCCDEYEGILNIQGQIVGRSFDSNDVCGVFVMERSEE